MSIKDTNQIIPVDILQKMSAYEFEKQSQPLPALGFSLAENESNDNETGLYVVKINPMKSKGKNQIHLGDRIESVNKQKVNSLDQFISHLKFHKLEKLEMDVLSEEGKS